MRSRFLLYVAVLLSAEMYFGKVAHADATPTTLQDYLNQVHGKNQEQVGSQIGIEAAKLKAFESELIFTPKIIYHPQSGWFEDTPLKGGTEEGYPLKGGMRVHSS